MKPVIALVGRPNVGKSTLFNRLTRTRDALVADLPGLTRDRNYGIGKLGDKPYIVIDTGGLSEEKKGIDSLMVDQAMLAVNEADIVLLMVDGRAGLTSADQSIVQRLRQAGKPMALVVNKTEGIDDAMAVAEFQVMGFKQYFSISASHGDGVADLVDELLAPYPVEEASVEDDADKEIRIAVVGRPNVGKSTLVNRILGEERVLAYDQPGTTRDSIFIPFKRGKQDYILIDTAGIRRRGRVNETIEKFSVIKTMQAITSADVVILILDAQQGISDQDAKILGHVLESGKALVIAVNKWDGLPADEKEKTKGELDRKLSFIDFAEIHYISALRGSGIGGLFKSVTKAYQSSRQKLSTPSLTRMLEAAVQQHAPPLVKGRRVKLRYAHQGGHAPPVIIIHGNQTAAVTESYRRYLTNFFRNELGLEGTPLKVEFKSGDNPFKGRKNILTKRQQEKKRRLKRFVKRKGR